MASRNSTPHTDLLTSEQVMDRLLAEPLLRRKAVTCVLSAIQSGNDWRFSRRELETWIARQLEFASPSSGV